METNRENWHSIDGYANYEVSSHGRVRNATTERILKLVKDTGGYPIVKLCKNGKSKTHKVHRLVANEFIDNPQNKKCIDHMDGVRTNNRLYNLRWASHIENNRNCVKQANTSSIFKGVCLSKRSNKWIAYIQIAGSKKHLGCFETEKEAAKAYNEAAAHYFGEYAKLNEID